MPNSIKKYRQIAHLTQKALADKLGESIDSVKRYENGKRQPRAETLQKMSAIFGVTIEELLKESE